VPTVLPDQGDKGRHEVQKQKEAEKDESFDYHHATQ
jgi:hypothetical protein